MVEQTTCGQQLGHSADSDRVGRSVVCRVAAPRKKHVQGERVTRGGGLNDKTDNLGSKNERSNKGMKLTLRQAKPGGGGRE
jgi:hypothetical protein